MFEFTDKTKKKIKVINVTEARGNFAAILADTDAHYVITKNNKPQRVIIGFEDFKKLQSDLGAPGLGDVVPPHESTEDASSLRKPKSSPAVRGMIAAQIELSQQNEKLPPEVPADFSLETVEAAPKEGLDRISSFLEEQSLEAHVHEEADVSGDYFGAEDTTLVEPEDFEEKADALQGVEDVEESVIKANRDALIQDTDFFETNAAASEPATAEAEPQRTAEEEAYFRRYRKLYEGYPPAFSEEGKKEPSFIIPEIKAARTITEAPLVRDAALDAGAWLLTEEKSLPVAKSSRVMPEPVRENERRQTSAPDPDDASVRVQPEEGLPSLQELLRDLDKQRLTGEEPHPLDARDIDDIINRITSD